MSLVANVREPVQDRAVKTREAIVRAGEAEFSAKGYKAATTKSIAAAAGVATGTVYQYFPNKDVLLREIASERLLRVGRDAMAGLRVRQPALALPAEVRARMEAMIGVVTAYHRDDPGLHAVLSERRHADPDLDALTSRAERMLIDSIAAQLVRWGHPGDTLATAFVLFGMVEGSVHAHVLGQSVVDDARFSAALADALIRVALPQHPMETGS